MKVSFDTIGSIAIIRHRPGETLEQERKAAKAIMRNNRSIRGVFRRVGRTEGKERLSKFVFICGDKNQKTVHKENGCVFYVDIKKVYFSPRLSTERARVARSIKKSDNVLDMFCGVGPFTIQAAKKASYVAAIDINKDAITLLQENIKANKVENVRFFLGDAKKILNGIKTRFDVIIMNNPTMSRNFLPNAVRAAKDRCTIFFYEFLKAENGLSEAEKTDISSIKRILSAYCDKVSIKPHVTGEAAPYLYRMCFDIKIKKSSTRSS
ncbi:methyltransferase domain-containing protein [Candidatus Parvarchaeota archaeon]|nr:methyltransferase domain-containing protein [Candidatus Parvarchaeota archaeon]